MINTQLLVAPLRSFRMLEAYIDSCEALRLNPGFMRAYECKAAALCFMGHADKAVDVVKDAKAIDSSYIPDPSIMLIDPLVTLGSNAGDNYSL